MLRNSLIVITIYFLVNSLVFAQYQLKFVDICANGNTIGVIYMRDSNSTQYAYGFYSFCDNKMDLRNLNPPVRNITTNSGTVLLDSCTIYRTFTQYNNQTDYHKYIYEIRSPFLDDSTIALEYGNCRGDTVYNPLTNGVMSKVNSYFIILAVADQYASEYEPEEISQQHIFADSNGNSLYELIYDNNVVGIKYFCVNNNILYQRYFKGKN